MFTHAKLNQDFYYSILKPPYHFIYTLFPSLSHQHIYHSKKCFMHYQETTQ